MVRYLYLMSVLTELVSVINIELKLHWFWKFPSNYKLIIDPKNDLILLSVVLKQNQIVWPFFEFELILLKKHLLDSDISVEKVST